MPINQGFLFPQPVERHFGDYVENLILGLFPGVPIAVLLAIFRKICENIETDAFPPSGSGKSERAKNGKDALFPRLSPIIHNLFHRRKQGISRVFPCFPLFHSPYYYY